MAITIETSLSTRESVLYDSQLSTCMCGSQCGLSCMYLYLVASPSAQLTTSEDMTLVSSYKNDALALSACFSWCFVPEAEFVVVLPAPIAILTSK